MRPRGISAMTELETRAYTARKFKDARDDTIPVNTAAAALAAKVKSNVEIDDGSNAGFRLGFAASRLGRNEVAEW